MKDWFKKYYFLFLIFFLGVGVGLPGGKYITSSLEITVSVISALIVVSIGAFATYWYGLKRELFNSLNTERIQANIKVIQALNEAYIAMHMYLKDANKYEDTEKILFNSQKTLLSNQIFLTKKALKKADEFEMQIIEEILNIESGEIPTDPDTLRGRFYMLLKDTIDQISKDLGIPDLLKIPPLILPKSSFIREKNRENTPK